MQNRMGMDTTCMPPRRIVMQGVKEALPALLQAFQDLDADNSGCLTKEDCEKMLDWRKRPETYVASGKWILKNR